MKKRYVALSEASASYRQNPPIKPEMGINKYYFGNIPKHEALSMWRCDLLTGELTRAVLHKEYKTDPRTTNKNGGTRITTYWAESQKSWFFISAKNRLDAKNKFEAQFKMVEEKLREREEQKNKNTDN